MTAEVRAEAHVDDRRATESLRPVEDEPRGGEDVDVEDGPRGPRAHLRDDQIRFGSEAEVAPLRLTIARGDGRDVGTMADEVRGLVAFDRVVQELVDVRGGQHRAGVVPRAPEGRLELELAILADKSDVTEELARLDAHLAEFDKSADGKLSSVVIELKSLLEKLREQVQNVL